MALFAIIRGNIVDGITIADAPIPTDGEWIDITNIESKPQQGWIYENGVFTQPPASEPIIFPPVKTEEEKLADAVAAAVAKLIADGVLKQ